MQAVRIYSTQWCPYCTAAKRFFNQRGVPFEEVDLTEDDEGRVELGRRTGQRTVPQIFIGDTHVGGYTDLVALASAGRLDPLLAGG